MNVLPRRKFTSAVISAVSTETGKPVGDAEAPDGGGWQGEVNDSDFVPYTVVTPMGSPQGEGPIGDAQSIVEFQYGLTCYGVSREQCEWMADEARLAGKTLVRTTVELSTGLSVSVMGYWVTSYGQVDRVGEEPPWWVQTDTVVFNVSP